MLMALNGNYCIPIVRVPSADPIFAQKALDVGGMGILAPMVRTATEARAIVLLPPVIYRRAAMASALYAPRATPSTIPATSLTLMTIFSSLSLAKPKKRSTTSLRSRRYPVSTRRYWASLFSPTAPIIHCWVEQPELASTPFATYNAHPIWPS